MPDVFISYSRRDAKIAEGFRNRLQAAGLSVFLDTASLAPGAPWSQELRTRLGEASVVLILASVAAIQSPMVNQEAGAAVLWGKKVIPIVWELDPANLPGWLREYQALDLRGGDPVRINTHVTELIGRLLREKQQSQVIAIVALIGLAALLVLSGK